LKSWHYPLVINGHTLRRDFFETPSHFYEGFACHTSSANPLDISAAIGFARIARKPAFSESVEILNRAAAAFSYKAENLEQAVRMTGMPVTEVTKFFDHIPDLLRQPSSSLAQRFDLAKGDITLHLELLEPDHYQVIQPSAGFCYAVTPGSDPRAAALVSANLVALGIPFILRASPRDAAAPLILQALLNAGVDPRFCSLLYLDPNHAQFPEKHYKLVDASALVWTFGPAGVIDSTLRFEQGRKQVSLGLSGLPIDTSSKISLLSSLELIDEQELFVRLNEESTQIDHFAGKPIIRHEAGNCAAISWGELTGKMHEIVFESLAYPIVCTALKTIIYIEAPTFPAQLANLLKELVVGDPLEPDTQVGFVNPHHLDRLQKLLESNRGRLEVFGGRRLSPNQAEPLLVSTSHHLPDFISREIPAYVLAARPARDLQDAVNHINLDIESPRLAVALFNSPARQRLPAVRTLNAHTILVDIATSSVYAALHEGNDYTLKLSQRKLLRF
jgi:acyl-CoA reductase-like NAD-dependent aldehyde dehydrogenase